MLIFPLNFLLDKCNRLESCLELRQVVLPWIGNINPAVCKQCSAIIIINGYFSTATTERFFKQMEKFYLFFFFPKPELHLILKTAGVGRMPHWGIGFESWICV